MNWPLWIPALGWSLLYFVWQGLLVGALSAAALWLLRGGGARARHAVCALALLACVSIPLAHLLYLLGADELPHSGLSVTGLNAWMPSLVLAWSAGVALMSLRLLLGLAWVARPWPRRPSGRIVSMRWRSAWACVFRFPSSCMTRWPVP